MGKLNFSGSGSTLDFYCFESAARFFELTSCMGAAADGKAGFGTACAQYRNSAHKTGRTAVTASAALAFNSDELRAIEITGNEKPSDSSESSSAQENAQTDEPADEAESADSGETAEKHDSCEDGFEKTFFKKKNKSAPVNKKKALSQDPGDEALTKSRNALLAGCPFEVVSPGMLLVKCRGIMWLRPAAVAASRGNLRFARDPGLLTEGLCTFLYKAFTGETSFLGVAKGEGEIFLSNSGHKVMLVHLDDETINIQGYSVLAFEDTLNYSVHMMGNVAGIMAGGLYSLRLEGTGWAAFSSCGAPCTTVCSPEAPLSCMPIKALAWSSGCRPEVQTDVTRINLMGRGFTDMMRMVFSSDGYVTLHGDEEYMYPRLK